MRPLRLGIDGDALRKPLAGVGQYVFNLCREIESFLPKAELLVYTRLPAQGIALPSDRWTLRNEPVAALRKLPSFVWLKTRGRTMCLADGIDVFWAGRTIHPGLAGAARTVSTVHDLNHLLVPETMEWPTRWSHRVWFRRDLLSSDFVVANSYGTAERVRTMLHVQVHGVVPPGLAQRFRRSNAQSGDDATSALSALGVRAPYLLSVATLEPRKNVDVLLTAFLDLKQRGELADHQLVLVGARGWQNRMLGRRIAAAKGHGVVVTGYVPDGLMPALYSAADALVFPSTYEGFGMPVLEARACGTPVVVSNIPELREAGGPHAIAVEPDVAGVRSGILRALTSQREPRLDEGLAERYSWHNVAECLAAVLCDDHVAAT